MQEINFRMTDAHQNGLHSTSIKQTSSPSTDYKPLHAVSIYGNEIELVLTALQILLARPA